MNTMTNEKEVLGRVSDIANLLLFWCPGCGYAHHLQIAPGPANYPCWTWNGSFTTPTASPSLLINKDKRGGSPRCHLFIKSGKIQFLNDCTHPLAGQTVPMTPWEEV